MLARRFTIVCLITMLFALGFARIVGQSPDSPGGWRSNLPTSCATNQANCQSVNPGFSVAQATRRSYAN